MRSSKEHPERKPNRLAGYDYSRVGAYFITINVYQRELLFGEIKDGVMRLNELGKIGQEVWEQTSFIRPYVELDEFVVMPNHFHAILFIHEHEGNRASSQSSVRATGRSPLHKDSNPRGPAPKSLGAIIAGFKGTCTKRINQQRGLPGHPVWQRSYHDHVIRNDKDLKAIREYILANPINWQEDENHPDAPS